MRSEPFLRRAEARADQSSTGLLITGCPRSGTKYVAHLLAALGRDVGHERMGVDGISSWCMAVQATEAPWGPSRHERLRFDVILQQVRNPTLAIPSMSTLNHRTWTFVYAHTPCTPSDPLIVRSARLWYHWNLHAEKVAHWRYLLERLEEVFPEFCCRVSAQADPSVLKKVGININSRAYRGAPRLVKWLFDRFHCEPPRFLRQRFVDRSLYQREKPFDWRLLGELDRPLCDQVIEMAQRYGYTSAELGLEGHR
jgi:hypothetical protein